MRFDSDRFLRVSMFLTCDLDQPKGNLSLLRHNQDLKPEQCQEKFDLQLLQLQALTSTVTFSHLQVDFK